MEKISGIFKAYRWPLLAGILVGTTYVPFPPWALLFCYAPLWLWLDEDVSSRAQAFWGAWLTQFVLTLIGFHWIAYTAAEFGGFHWILSGLTLILFAAFIHLYIPLAALVAWELKSRLNLSSGRFFVVAALILALFERVWPSIFPWNLGYTLMWAKVPAYQWADTIGFEGLSTLILLLNAWVAYIWQKQDDTQKVFTHVTFLAVTVVALTLSGLWKKREWKKAEAVLKVAAIQANIGNSDKIAAEQGFQNAQKLITERFVELSRKILFENPTVDLLLWPETAFPDFADHPQGQPRRDLIRQGLAPLGRPLLTGAFSKDTQIPEGQTKAPSYNALFLLNASGEVISGPYRKTHLLAFGEYLPFSETFPKLLEWLPFIANFGRGPGPTVLELPRPDGRKLRLGAQICYEGLFPEFSRGLSDKGAEVLVNVTNDSWFGSPFEPRQHMIMTLARAVETRRPLIRSTNTGITTAVTAAGDQLDRSPVGRIWTGILEVPFRKDPPESFYVAYGHWNWILLLLTLGGLLGQSWRHVRSVRP